jgi:MFS family permease
VSGGPAPSRWRHLAVGVLGLVAACAAQYGLPFLTVAWRSEGLSLAQIGLLVSAPLFGLMATLIGWGALADRFGERFALTAGLGIGACALAGAASSATPPATGLWLVLAGAGTASVHAASGRLVLGWFPPRQRGLAMGIRQAGQPIGMGLAALILPRVGDTGTARAFAVLAVGCAAAAVLVGLLVRDPERPEQVPGGSATSSPYRGPVLWRLHAGGALLVVPQFAVAAYAFDFLVRGAGWGVAAAGGLLALAQGGGVLARLGAGVWSDRAGSRVGPLRLITAAVAAIVALLALTAGLTPSPLAPALTAAAVVAAAVVTVSPNGVAFTAVAEQAGSGWAGRALGAHNTGQHVFAVATVPLAGLLIDAGAGYASAFGLGTAAALAALPVLPRRDGDRRDAPAASVGAP